MAAGEEVIQKGETGVLHFQAIQSLEFTVHKSN